MATTEAFKLISESIWEKAGVLDLVSFVKADEVAADDQAQAMPNTTGASAAAVPTARGPSESAEDFKRRKQEENAEKKKKETNVQSFVKQQGPTTTPSAEATQGNGAPITAPTKTPSGALDFRLRKQQELAEKAKKEKNLQNYLARK